MRHRWAYTKLADLDRSDLHDELHGRGEAEDRWLSQEFNKTCEICGTQVEHESDDFCKDCEDFDNYEADVVLVEQEARFADLHILDSEV